MFLSQTLNLLLIISGAQPSNTFYNYGVNIQSVNKPQTLVASALSNDVYYINCDAVLSFNASYDDSESFYLTDFNLNISLSSYYLSGNQIIYENGFNLNTRLDWEITPSSYNQQLSNISFRYGIDNDDYMYLNIYDNNEIINSDKVLLNDEFSSTIRTRNDVLYNDSLINSVESLLSQLYGQSESDSYQQGYSNGHIDGYNDGLNVDSTVVTIFNGILNIALVPINFFLGMFNFEILGINMSAFVSALLSVALIIIVIRLITGKKSE